MIEFIYGTLNSIGFHHPLHPVATHIPMGLILGGFLFAIGSFKWEALEKTAFYCLVLALVNLPVTIIFGLLDWLHIYKGKLIPYIIAKMSLAGVIVIFVSLTVYLYHKGKINKTVFVVLYFLCFATAVALGFIGGQLIFGGGI